MNYDEIVEFTLYVIILSYYRINNIDNRVDWNYLTQIKMPQQSCWGISVCYYSIMLWE